jgi:ribose transport system ATP-binding protein
MSAGLSVTGITKRFGATVALAGVDLAVAPGEVHGVIGENGAGKSTLMAVLAGDVGADRGSMTLDGAEYSPANPHAARARGVVRIHQELSLCAHLSVMDNVLLGAEIARGGWIDRERSRARAQELLDELPHPGIHPDRRVGDLSLPARQIVEICRALAANARIVLMDEPTSSLQGADVERLFSLIRRLAARGVSIIYISHFLEEVRRIVDRYTVLRDGRSVAAGAISDATDTALIRHMVGRPATELFPARQRTTDGAVALSVRNLSAPPRLHSASFDLRRGEILGIAGLIGSGRTEMVRALFGLERPASGTVQFAGRTASAAATTSRERVRGGVGYLSEDRTGEGLTLSLSIADNVCATRPELSMPRLGIIDRHRQAERTQHWIQHLRIRAASTAQRVRALSGGNQQKVAISRMLHQEAGVMLLDEPTRGIDIGAKADVYEVMARQAEAGCALLIVSSYVTELFGICDRLAVMCRGRLSEARPIAAWTHEGVLAAAIGSVSLDTDVPD